LGDEPAALPLTLDPLAGLDPEQRAAAEVVAGPLLIIAGPGTGKTRTLTHRIAHLITKHGVAPERILAVTFTYRAANEMKERLQKLLPALAGQVLVTTFHGLGYRILREHGARIGLPENFRVASEAERRALLVQEFGHSDRKAGQRLKRFWELRRLHSEAEVRSPPFRVPGDGGHAEAWTTNPPTEEERLIRAAYERAMRQRGWLDFEDLLLLPARLLEADAGALAHWRERFAFVSVDEFQDIDAAQYRLVQLLVPPEGNLCVIGDPDQAIYGFRGSDVRLFSQFAADYSAARTVQLRRNYRSGRAIVQGALQAVAPATLVEGRVLEALSLDDAKIVIHEAPTDKAEAEFVVHTIEKLIGGHAFFSLDSGRVAGSESGSGHSFGDFAALYRTAAQADALCEALGRSGIPFQRHSHEPLAEREGVRGLLAVARELSGELPVAERLRQALENPKPESQNPKEARKPKPEEPDAIRDSDFGFLAEFVLRISDLAHRCGHDFARFESELALFTEADLWDGRADRVSLLTLHASKGLEFGVVFITGCEAGLLPLRFGPASTANTDEERRLFFVGMTRARERLFLTHAAKRLWRGQHRQQELSPFVSAIERELLERAQLPPLKPRERPSGVQMDLL
jgi:DNA helicase-2/ATP-dependent DNA helicase PcrA